MRQSPDLKQMLAIHHHVTSHLVTLLSRTVHRGEAIVKVNISFQAIPGGLPKNEGQPYHVCWDLYTNPGSESTFPFYQFKKSTISTQLSWWAFCNVYDFLYFFNWNIVDHNVCNYQTNTLYTQNYYNMLHSNKNIFN